MQIAIGQINNHLIFFLVLILGFFAIKDVTKKYIEFLVDAREKEDWAPTIGQYANRGQGKTAQAFKTLYLLLYSDKRPHYLDVTKKVPYYRNVALYKAPETILNAIKEAFPEDLAKRFRIINDIYEAKPFEIIYCDEAGRLFDGKMALKKKMREIVEGFTYARHNSNPIIYSSTIVSVLKNLRVLTEIYIYKRMGKTMIQAFIKEGDSFVKEHKDILEHLKIDRCLIDANHRYFEEAGGLVMPLERFCPYWTKKIGDNMRGVNLAAERIEVLEEMAQMDQIINEVVAKYGPELHKGYASKLVKGWLYNEKPIELINIYEPYLPDIIAAAFQKYHDRKKKEMAVKTVREEIYVPKINTINHEKNLDFITFLSSFYIENIPGEIQLNQKSKFTKEQVVSVLEQWASGVGQRNIIVASDSNRLGRIPINLVGQILRVFRDGDGVIQNNLRIYNVYEHWVAKITGGTVWGGLGNPDEIYKIGELTYPAECKLYDDVSVSIAMDKNKKLKPSLEYCRVHNIPSFPLFFRNTKWGNYDYLFKVLVDGPDIVNIKKADEFILEKFEPLKFYEIEIEV